MRIRTMTIVALSSLASVSIGCRQQASGPEVVEMKDTTASKADTAVTKTAPQADTTAVKKYNFLDKVSGTYVLIKKDEMDDDTGAESMKVRISGKNKVIVNGETFKFDTGYEKKDTVLSFGKVSPDSGDWGGGGELRINGNKVTLIWLFGPEANERYVYRKR